MRFLMVIPAVAWLVSIALAVPHDKQKVQNVNVMIQQIKATSEMDITVVGQDSSQVLGYACSNMLNSGAFAEKPITATLDQNCAGTLAVGNQMYIVNEDPETSGGITCSRTYNDVESFILCAVSLPASLPLTPISNVEKKNCFNSGKSPSLQATFRSILAQSEAPETEGTNIIQRNELPTLHKRQAPCGQWSPSTQMVGDGDPHQNYLHTQLSVSILHNLVPTEAVREVGQLTNLLLRKMSIAARQQAVLSVSRRAFLILSDGALLPLRSNGLRAAFP
jgi:hypothetical protein